MLAASLERATEKLSFENELNKYSGQFAAVIMEPINFDWTYPDFLSEVRKLCDEKEVILIFDNLKYFSYSLEFSYI